MAQTAESLLTIEVNTRRGRRGAEGGRGVKRRIPSPAHGPKRNRRSISRQKIFPGGTTFGEHSDPRRTSPIAAKW